MLSLQINAFHRSCFFGLFFIISFQNLVYSQNKEGYNLLWEIEHKDSDKKSYLFGTMHLKDKRVFDFSDAMIPAIESSEAFAMEVHPDSIMEGVAKKFLEKDENNRIKKILSKEEYKHLEERFQKIKGKPMDSFSINYYNIDTMLFPDTDKEDDRTTFLDAYLYAIAHSMDKEILGLEQLEDQMPSSSTISDSEFKDHILDIIYTSEEEYITTIETMIELYAKGNLSAIQDYMGRESISSSMLRRNRIMVNSILEIIQDKSLFAAVGAGHLPGENGMIDMLRKEGFTVNIVESKFTGTSNNYELKPNLKRWFTDKDDSKGYSVLIPSPPIPYAIEKDFDVLTSIDLVSGVTFAYYVRPLNNTLNEEEANAMVENYITTYAKSQEMEIVDIRPYNKNNLSFKEVRLKGDTKFQKTIVGVTNNILYGFLSEYTNQSQENDYVNIFFNSIEIFSPTKTLTQWTTSVNEEASYSINFPNQEISKQQIETPNPLDEEGEPYIIDFSVSKDEENNTTYFIRHNDLPLGYYMEDDREIINEFKNHFTAMGTLIEGPTDTIFNGLKTTQYEALLKDSTHAVARLYLRGNRVYVLMAQNADRDKKVDFNNPFFDSFQYLEYPRTQPLDYLLNMENKYSIAFPGEYKMEIDSVSFDYTEFLKSTSYYSKNPVTGGAYMIEQGKLKPYYRLHNLDTLYHTYKENITGYNDTIVWEKKTMLHGLPALEILYKNKKSENYHLMKMLLDNDNYFALTVYDAKEEIEGDMPRLFFEGFKKNFDKDYFHLYENKTHRILKDINNRDTLTANAARQAFYYYEFQKEDIPLLVKELNKSFDDDEEYLGVKNKIIASLGELDDVSIVPILKKHYQNKKTSNAQKITILETLPYMSGSEAMATYTDLLFSDTPTPMEDENFDVFEGMQNENFNYITYSDKIKELFNNTGYREVLLEYANYISRNDSTATVLFEKANTNWFTHFKKDTEVYVDTLKRNNNAYATYFLISNYLNLLETLKPNDLQIKQGIHTLTKQLPASDWLHTRALVASIHVGVEIDPKVLSRSMDTLYSRFEIMEAFVNNNQQGQIPESYLEGIEFSKLSFINYIGDYYDQIDNIKLLGQVEHEDKNYYVFDFFITGDEEEKDGDGELSKYICVVENSPVDFSEFSQNNVYFDWESVEEDWEAQAATIIKNGYTYYYD